MQGFDSRTRSELARIQAQLPSFLFKVQGSECFQEKLRGTVAIVI